MKTLTTYQNRRGERQNAATLLDQISGINDHMRQVCVPAWRRQDYREAWQGVSEMARRRMPGLDSPLYVCWAGSAMEGAVYSHNRVDPEFGEQYLKQFGNDLQLTSAGSGYDFYTLVCKLFSAGDSGGTSEQIVETILKSGPHEGVQGSYSFVSTPENGVSAKFPIVLKKVEKGAVRVVK